MSQQSESDHERGRSEPDVATLLAYARALGCSVDELLADPAGGASVARDAVGTAAPYGNGKVAAQATGAGLAGRVVRLEQEVPELRERLAVLEVLTAGNRRPQAPRNNQTAP